MYSIVYEFLLYQGQNVWIHKIDRIISKNWELEDDAFLQLVWERTQIELSCGVELSKFGFKWMKMKGKMENCKQKWLRTDEKWWEEK